MRAGVRSMEETTWIATSPTLQPNPSGLVFRSASDKDPRSSAKAPRASSRPIQISARIGSALSSIDLPARLLPNPVSITCAWTLVHPLSGGRRRPGFLEQTHRVRHEAPEPTLADGQVRLVGHVGAREAPGNGQQ